MFLTNKNKIRQFFYNVELCYNATTYSTQGYLDSANYLKDKNNNPVIIINKNTFDNIFKNNLIDKQKIIQNRCNIQISTLSDNKQQIPCFLLDKLVIYSNKNCYIHKNVTVAISSSLFQNQVQAEVLLSPYLFD